MRISEVALRTGVNAATLRAWERRYGILRPERTGGGHRVYTMDDVARVRAVAVLVDGGMRPAAAAERISASVEGPAPGAVDEVRVRLWDTIDRFDEQGARASLVEAGALLAPPALCDEVLVPVLRRLGEGWRGSPRSIAREHFTSSLVRSYLVSMLPSAHDRGPTCLAFCPEGEQHDIGLLMATVVVATTGARAVFVGGHTPRASIDVLLEELRPSLVLVAATTRRTAARLLTTWRSRRGRHVVAGGGGFRADDEATLRGPVHLGAYAALPAVVQHAMSATKPR
ncbi:MAG: MerR family transcriptional regulator [Actinobacteria bacterium]|nr:MerR family transcriptional regulator [Actinomycetota bacterium]